MDSGINFSDVAGNPDYAHVGAWVDDDGVVTVAYLGTFPKQTAELSGHIGVHQSVESLATALLVDLARKAELK